MGIRQKQTRQLFLFFFLFLSSGIAGCGSPQYILNLEVSAANREVQVGKEVAILAKVAPLEKLDLKWSVSGTADGKLNTDIGEQVVYTAGKKGVDIVVAEGTTANGAPVRQTLTLTVVSQVVEATAAQIA